jgi:hypothetical protein
MEWVLEKQYVFHYKVIQNHLNDELSFKWSDSHYGLGFVPAKLKFHKLYSILMILNKT